MNKREWILYTRSFLLTMGGSFILFSLWFAIVNFMRDEFLELLPICVFIAFNSLGVFLLYYGIYGDNKKVESIANDATTHWASLVIMALAYPVYLIVYAKKGRKPNA